MLMTTCTRGCVRQHIFPICRPYVTLQINKPWRVGPPNRADVYNLLGHDLKNEVHTHGPVQTLGAFKTPSETPYLLALRRNVTEVWLLLAGDVESVHDGHIAPTPVFHPETLTSRKVLRRNKRGTKSSSEPQLLATAHKTKKSASL